MRKRTEAQIKAEKKYEAATKLVAYFRRIKPEHKPAMDELLNRLKKETTNTPNGN